MSDARYIVRVNEIPELTIRIEKFLSILEKTPEEKAMGAEYMVSMMLGYLMIDCMQISKPLILFIYRYNRGI